MAAKDPELREAEEAAAVAAALAASNPSLRLEAEAAAKKRAAKLAAPSGARCEAAPPSAPAAAQKDSSALEVLEVGVGGGKSARLPVHAGDIPAVIAAKFASEHGLPAAYQQKLVGMIEQQVAIHSQGGA